MGYPVSTLILIRLASYWGEPPNRDTYAFICIYIYTVHNNTCIYNIHDIHINYIHIYILYTSATQEGSPKFQTSPSPSPDV